MITWDEVKQINSKLVLENGGSPEEDSSCEEISSIVYYTDVIECEGTAVIHRHIDIEYSFGDYSMIEAFLVAKSINASVVEARDNYAIRNYIIGRRPAQSSTWTNLKLVEYNFNQLTGEIDYTLI